MHFFLKKSWRPFSCRSRNTGRQRRFTVIIKQIKRSDFYFLFTLSPKQSNTQVGARAWAKAVDLPAGSAGVAPPLHNSSKNHCTICTRMNIRQWETNTFTAPLGIVTYKRSHSLHKYTISSYRVYHLITTNQTLTKNGTATHRPIQVATYHTVQYSTIQQYPQSVLASSCSCLSAGQVPSSSIYSSVVTVSQTESW